MWPLNFRQIVARVVSIKSHVSFHLRNGPRRWRALKVWYIKNLVRVAKNTIDIISDILIVHRDISANFAIFTATWSQYLEFSPPKYRKINHFAQSWYRKIWQKITINSCPWFYGICWPLTKLTRRLRSAEILISYSVKLQGNAWKEPILKFVVPSSWNALGLTLNIFAGSRSHESFYPIVSMFIASTLESFRRSYQELIHMKTQRSDLETTLSAETNERRRRINARLKT